MVKPLNELLALRADLDEQIARAQREAKSEAIAQVKALMTQYGLSLADIQGTPASAKRAVKTGAKVAVKYRDRNTGDTWTGRGLQPKWLRAAVAAGKKPADFAV